MEKKDKRSLFVGIEEAGGEEEAEDVQTTAAFTLY